MSDDAPSMTSYRPYLLRALTAWINDNGMTPHILVDAGVPGVRVPPGTVREGKVVLNIADRAVVGLHMDNEWIGFTARFGGVSQKVDVPVGAVLAVYARAKRGRAWCCRKRPVRRHGPLPPPNPARPPARPRQVAFHRWPRCPMRPIHPTHPVRPTPRPMARPIPRPASARICAW